MDYETYEQSVASGEPIELYDLAMGATHWRMASGELNIVYQEQTYEGLGCRRSEVKQTGEIPKDRVEIELPIDHEIAQICVRGVPESEISVTIYRGHAGAFITYWKGYLTSVSLDTNGVPKCRFAPLSSDLPSVGGRRPVQRLCPHVPYRARCGLDREEFKVEGLIASIDGLEVSSPVIAEAQWYFDYGGEPTEDIVYNDLTCLPGCTYNASGDYGVAYTSHWNNAFDDRPGYPGWRTYPQMNQWIWCQWASAKVINRIHIQACPWVDFYKWSVRHLKVEASNNGTDWTKLPVTFWLSNCSPYNTDEVELALQRNYTTWAKFTLDNQDAYTHYRLFCYDTWGGHRWVSGTLYRLGIGEIEMTRDSTIPGEFPEISKGLGAGGLFVAGGSERMITAHQGETIKLNRTIPGLKVGDSFTAYAGCDHSPNTCRFKFGNILNYGGWEFLPMANPYESNIYY